jgi:tetratricopeptide (TPR) repeat protein
MSQRVRRITQSTEAISEVTDFIELGDESRSNSLYEEAIQYYLQALDVYQTANLAESEFDFVRYEMRFGLDIALGKAYSGTGDSETAQGYFETALEEVDVYVATFEHGIGSSMATTIAVDILLPLALIHSTRGEYDTATLYLEEAISLADQLDDNGMQAFFLNQLALNLYASGNNALALELWNKRFCFSIVHKARKPVRFGVIWGVCT